MGAADRTCAVCGRTILAGEQVRGYLNAGGRRTVCELCVARAERLGWLPEGETEAEAGAGASRQGGSRRLLGGLLRRRRAGPVEPSSPRPSTASRPDPAAPGRRPEGMRSDDPVQAGPFERAVVRFNAGEAGHTVAGLARTLGVPSVSVGASAGAPNEVRITVAWELSWYQWGVDLSDELRPAFQIDKGQEVSQLDAAARQWNASTTEDGALVLGAGGRRPAGAGARR